jgi:mono/diheme cytochrome c family protein
MQFSEEDAEPLGDIMKQRGSAMLGIAVMCGIATFGSARAETLLERGTYLVQGIAACGDCHTPRDAAGHHIATMEMAGGFEMDLMPLGKPVAANITPDKETGIGNWTDEQIVTAIREGKRPDGRIIGPPMPIPFYRQLSDRDIHAIVAYLRALPPIHNAVAKSVYALPLPPSYGPPVTSVPEVSASDKVAYGAYLAGPVGHCMECHTPVEKGRLDMTRLGAGGREFKGDDGVVVSANLTPDKTDGLGGWSDAAIKNAITKNIKADGSSLVPFMPTAWFAKISDPDLDAIVAYLRSLKPVASR